MEMKTDFMSDSQEISRSAHDLKDPDMLLAKRMIPLLHCLSEILAEQVIIVERVKLKS